MCVQDTCERLRSNEYSFLSDFPFPRYSKRQKGKKGIVVKITITNRLSILYSFLPVLFQRTNLYQESYSNGRITKPSFNTKFLFMQENLDSRWRGGGNELSSTFTKRKYPKFTVVCRCIGPGDFKTRVLHSVCNIHLPLFPYHLYTERVQANRVYVRDTWVVMIFCV